MIDKDRDRTLVVVLFREYVDCCHGVSGDYINYNDKESSLWMYDRANKSYIYFENQKEMRLAFHGYHVVDGEENYQNIDVNKINEIS